MARLKEENEQMTRKLITRVTGFEDNEENFQLCLQFAHSNFKFHRFLDVDSHRVTRQLEGLYTKLKVHSLGERAGGLKELVDSFLHSPLHEGKDDTQTDTHYALLSLLCLLANSPTNTEYQPTPVHVEEEPVDTFDWAGHLLEGESDNLFNAYYSDTSSEEDPLPETSEGEDGDSQEAAEISPTPIPAPAESNSTLSISRAPDVSTETLLEQDRGEQWLSNNLMVQYWKGQGHQGQGQEEEELSRHSSCNLLKDWTSYQVRSGELYAVVGQRVVTEYQIVREIIWMLLGADSLFMFERAEGRFRLKDSIRLPHLSGASLANCITHLTSLADHLHELQAFINEVVGVSCRPLTPGRSCLGSQTYQAFADSLSRILTDFRAHLSSLERKAAIQDDSNGNTIASLAKKLSPWIPTLDALWEVFTSGVKVEAEPPRPQEGQQHVCNSGQVSRLLTALYDGVVLQDSLGHLSVDIVSLLLRLLLQTSKPYLDIISLWISAGQLCDPASEFVLQRNENIPSLDETFWERAFTLNNSAAFRTNRDGSTSNTSLSSAGLCAEEEEVERGFQDLLEASPKFLRPVMRDVVLTGKSMELLQALGRLPEVLASVGSELFEDKSLYQLFVNSLKDILGTVPSEEKVVLQGETTVKTSVSVQQVYIHSRLRGREDYLLQINFSAIFSAVFTQKQVPTDPYDLSALGRVEDAYVGPIYLLFQRCLYPHIRRRYQHVCSRLLEILKQEYKLMDFLASMQHFYLMSAGDAMFDFCTQIFDKMRHQELWRDPSSLTLTLQEALHSHHAHHVSRLSISLEQQSKTRERSAVTATDCIRLHFNVPWPVDVVISSKCQNLYNQVFLFLLQIKRAKYGLDQLRFTDLDKPEVLTVTSNKDLALAMGSRSEEKVSRSERLHRLHVLRFRLAYFVNSLHNYIMTRILHSTGLEFADEIKEASDLEQVIEIHARYVRTIHERCLLHKKLAFLKDAVSKVLNLTLAFAMRWDQGVHNISVQSLKDMEVEFSRCIQFLASFLNNIIKRGSFPHVEPLAFALVTSLPGETKF